MIKNNPYLLIPFLTLLIAQSAKVVHSGLGGKFNPKLFFSSGGLVSAHTGLVSALAATILIRDGYENPLFAVSLILAVIVIYDSLGVRRANWQQGLVVKALAEISKLAGRDKLATRVMGHQPKEVVAGVLLGIAVALLLWPLYA